jgi:hypothetical protein
MTLATFIKENKVEIDAIIKKQAPNATINNEERRLWILNYEYLYNWARRCGVKI